MPVKKGSSVIGPSGRPIKVGGPTWEKLSPAERSKLKAVAPGAKKEKLKKSVASKKKSPTPKKKQSKMSWVVVFYDEAEDSKSMEVYGVFDTKEAALYQIFILTYGPLCNSGPYPWSPEKLANTIIEDSFLYGEGSFLGFRVVEMVTTNLSIKELPFEKFKNMFKKRKQ